MLSKEEFKRHLDMIDHNTMMAQTYKKHNPGLAKKCLEMVDEYKRILLNHFDEQQSQILVYELQLKGALFNSDYQPTPKRTIQLETTPITWDKHSYCDCYERQGFYCQECGSRKK